VDRRQAEALYYGVAAALGVFVALNPLPEPWQLVAVLLAGVGATLIRSQLLHAAAWSRTDLTWVLIFLATWAPASWLLHRWPFR
jgi:uncharacterized protein (DUF2062 family)